MIQESIPAFKKHSSLCLAAVSIILCDPLLRYINVVLESEAKLLSLAPLSSRKAKRLESVNPQKETKVSSGLDTNARLRSQTTTSLRI